MATARRKRVDLIDDDPAVLDSLGLYLESKGFEVRCLPSADAFVRQFEGEPPDCVVADVRMPGMTGLQLQNWLLRKGSPAPLVLITGHGDIEMAVSAMKAGAVDFLEKPVNEERLVTAIKNACRHAASSRAEAQELADIAERMESLSERERQVTEYATRGMTNREIATELGISPRTVEIYRAAAMQKTGARSLAELVRMVMRLQEPDTPTRKRR
jgi:two-component system response regulator FixJ